MKVNQSARFLMLLGLVGFAVEANRAGAEVAASSGVEQKVAAEAWDRFRGPGGTGVSAATSVPTTWTETDYNWRASLPGQGISSPVIWGDKLFVTAADETKLERYLLCYQTDNGSLLWQRGRPFVAEKKHARNSYATSTPAVDATRVYAVWQSRTDSQLIAYDHDGKELWQFELGPYKSGHGGGISPIVADGVVALNNAHEGDSCFIGIDAATGAQRWRVKREVEKASYSTPCTFTAADGKVQLIFTDWRHGTTCVEAQTGKIVWEQDTFESGDGEARRAIGSPFVAGDVIYGNCGFVNGKKFLAALKPAPAGGEPQLLFRLERTVNHMPTALVYEGRLYSWTDTGIVLCADALSGKTVWQGRVGGDYSGSPVCVGGKLYCLSEDGEMVVLATGEKFAELARVKLPEGSSSTPAVSRGVLYFRTQSQLFSLGKRG
ncbi:MAG: PQQ-binding-like beta-propeller repeat protein [Pirellulaceae bacterium]|nr:PQQ-binding-like beta-propeller repeat protein [Pirellulaceae bacterium]